MHTVPVLDSVPVDVVTLADHEARARVRLDPAVWAYLHGGAGDERTVHANRAAWDGLQLLPRVLRALAGGHTRLQLFGRTLAHPVLVAPVAFQRLAHADGEMAAVHAAAALGAGFVASTQASVPLEAIAQAVRADPDRGPLWFQLYWQHDQGVNRELLQRAEAAGYEAIVLTVDAPVSGVRDQERRSGFRFPADIVAANLQGQSPDWGLLQPGESMVFDRLLHAAPTWKDLEWLCGATALPVLPKGVLHPADALQALDCGARGLIVSNHGGRTLDTTVATAHALPAVVQAVAGRAPVLVDGGIRRGTDILKAVALGADAVLVGRPVVHGLATAGARGVAHVLRLLRDELEVAMALTGCRTLEDAQAALLQAPGGRS